MVDVSVTIDTEVEPTLHPGINNAVISAWVEGRLNDGRNTFITSLGHGPGHSSPGQYPFSQTGQLANSVDYGMLGPREGHLFSDLEYAAFLTDGTYKMAPRKMLWEALEQVMESRPDTDELAKAVTLTRG